MASPAVRISRSISRSWSSAFAGISRTLAASPNVIQSRGYSDEVSKDPFLATPAPAAEEPSLSFDSPAGSPLSDGFPEPAPKRPEQTGGFNRIDYRNQYPPRNYRTPRGVYKAIVLGEVGQLPIQKILKSGKSVTIFSVGTGGMFNNRRPFEGESPQEFAERSYTQWHRVAVYQDRIAGLVMQHMKVGSQVYVEGNIECRVYNDPNSGVIKRIREVAVRNNGRLMFMDGTGAYSAPAEPPIPVHVKDEPFTVPPVEPVNESL
ncbi:single-strand DNA-binding protein [Marchantia polymorpha subsp. ruderalis]|uniref:Single-stranded DNA-binding protein n=2 Tax=Marchantia polymorpha TaxID=3197 RepID=A0A176W7U1_MARPO|nr:hypothetical protein AXG93_1390s1230 [Marchantia polymorpha subsp. ruderalis]PTQ29953.1 hypothetical protein MARPO_0132s0028 [Marchantia polymorpha]BBN08223.1 hypothetical protein Mp_4g09850 [Marchantia polymorpha subsp. ruderalis]|eukprot:PTQ29953.1 hypothetical protein MARPO_0132s0028 [Marchantia polymorpha]